MVQRQGLLSRSTGVLLPERIEVGGGNRGGQAEAQLGRLNRPAEWGQGMMEQWGGFDVSDRRSRRTESR
jgi:hypothetical protein